MNDERLWLVTWAYYSEHAEAVVVEAREKTEAIAKALALVHNDSELEYVGERAEASPIVDGTHHQTHADH